MADICERLGIPRERLVEQARAMEHVFTQRVEQWHTIKSAHVDNWTIGPIPEDYAP